MQLHRYVDQVRAQLVAAAALGDEQAHRTARVLADAAEPAVRLAVLSAISAATDQITAALLDAVPDPATTVSAGLDGEDGDEIRIDVRVDAAPQPGPATAPTEPDDGDASARISLRLSEALKTQIEGAARADGISVNSWLARAAARALHTGDEHRPATRSTHRITGWING